MSKHRPLAGILVCGWNWCSTGAILDPFGKEEAELED